MILNNNVKMKPYKAFSATNHKAYPHRKYSVVLNELRELGISFNCTTAQMGCLLIMLIYECSGRCVQNMEIKKQE